MLKTSFHIMRLTPLILVLGYSTIPAYSQMQSERLPYCKEKCNRAHPNQAYLDCKRMKRCDENPTPTCKDECKRLPEVLAQNRPYDDCRDKCLKGQE